jgi:hypothetical protein
VTTLWDEVDEPVLRWVFSLPPSLSMELHTLELREPEPFEPIPGLDSRQIHDALSRLVSHGFVDGRESAAMQSSTWNALRVTAQGLIVLGQWPDLDRVASAAAIHRLLTALAEDAPVEERSALKRAAGAVSRTAAEVITGTVTDVARAAGREVVDE